MAFQAIQVSPATPASLAMGPLHFVQHKGLPVSGHRVRPISRIRFASQAAEYQPIPIETHAPSTARPSSTVNTVRHIVRHTERRIDTVSRSDQAGQDGTVRFFRGIQTISITDPITTIPKR